MLQFKTENIPLEEEVAYNDDAIADSTDDADVDDNPIRKVADAVKMRAFHCGRGSLSWRMRHATSALHPFPTLS